MFLKEIIVIFSPLGDWILAGPTGIGMIIFIDVQVICGQVTYGTELYLISKHDIYLRVKLSAVFINHKYMSNNCVKTDLWSAMVCTYEQIRGALSLCGYIVHCTKPW